MYTRQLNESYSKLNLRKKEAETMVRILAHDISNQLTIATISTDMLADNFQDLSKEKRYTNKPKPKNYFHQLLPWVLEGEMSRSPE